jgi:hypothetical protein
VGVGARFFSAQQGFRCSALGLDEAGLWAIRRGLGSGIGLLPKGRMSRDMQTRPSVPVRTLALCRYGSRF